MFEALEQHYGSALLDLSDLYMFQLHTKTQQKKHKKIPFLSVNEEYQYNLELQLQQHRLSQLVLKVPYREMLECNKKYRLKLKNYSKKTSKKYPER